MNPRQQWLVISSDRDSVSAGDDLQTHECTFHIQQSTLVVELIMQAANACRLASIANGKATWIVEAGGFGGEPIAVIAQQWNEPRLLVQETALVESLFYNRQSKLFFKYWCQADPDEVFNALETNSPLPSRFA